MCFRSKSLQKILANSLDVRGAYRSSLTRRASTGVLVTQHLAGDDALDAVLVVHDRQVAQAHAAEDEVGALDGEVLEHGDRAGVDVRRQVQGLVVAHLRPLVAGPVRGCVPLRTHGGSEW